MTAKRILIVLLASGAAAAGAVFELGVDAANVWAATSGVQVVDAQKDPAEAAKLLNQFCDPGSTPIPPGGTKIGNCDYAGTVPSVAYGPPRTVGQGVYNCTTGGGTGITSSYVEDSVEFSDERSASLTLKESLEASVTAGIVQAGVEFDSSQMAKVSVTNSLGVAVGVYPGEKGWVDSQVPVASITATITDLNAAQPFEIQNLGLSLPGYGDTSQPWALKSIGVYATIKDTDPSDQAVCSGLNVSPSSVLQGAPPSVGHQVTICRAVSRKRRRPVHTRHHKARRCTKRQLTDGTLPIRIRAQTDVALVRQSRVYASGIAGKQRVVLHARRPVRAGRYQLVLSRRRHSTMIQVALR